MSDTPRMTADEIVAHAKSEARKNGTLARHESDFALVWLMGEYDNRLSEIEQLKQSRDYWMDLTERAVKAGENLMKL